MYNGWYMLRLQSYKMFYKMKQMMIGVAPWSRNGNGRKEMDAGESGKKAMETKSGTGPERHVR